MSELLPLAGWRIIVTRSEEQSDATTAGLVALGAEVISVPTIQIVPSDLSPDDQKKISSMFGYDVTAFFSPNAVKNCFAHVSIPREIKSRPYIIAVGTGTAGALMDLGMDADFIPEKFTSKDLVNSLKGFEWKGKRVLIPAGNLSGDDFSTFAVSKGSIVDKVVVYRTEPNDAIDEGARKAVTSGLFDMIAFFSPSQVKNFIGIFGTNVLKGKEIAVIGPATKEAAERFGVAVDVVPSNSTMEDLIKSLIGYEKAQ